MLISSAPKVRLLVLSLALFAAGCRPSSYSAVSRADTIEGYRRFLREEPHDENVEVAEARLAELEFERASQLHNVIAYKRFLEEFPQSSNAEAARSLLEGLRFNAAREKGTAEAYRQFLHDHPSGKRRDEAATLLAEAELREARVTKDLTLLERVAAEHAEDPRADELKAGLDDKRFELAKEAGAAKLLEYLRRFPAGAHREEVRARLFSLKIDGLLVSGLLDEARAEVARSPFTAKLPDLGKRLDAAQKRANARSSKLDGVQAVLPQSYLRDLDSLEQVLAASDVLDRWQAVEELGQWTSVRAVELLVRALRGARNLRVRQQAYESLARVLKALPPPVAEYEIATRLESWSASAEDAEVFLAMAALLELSGQGDAAAREYRRAYQPGAPDAFILWRWGQFRRGRGHLFSAAVAARSLAGWAADVAKAAPELSGVSTAHGGTGETSLLAARELCAATLAAREALEIIGEAKRGNTEFPQDIVEFESRAKEAVALTQARLRDAELSLQSSDGEFRGCEDASVSERVLQSEKARDAALKALRAKAPRLAPLLLEEASQTDPSPALRALAKQLLSK